MSVRTYSMAKHRNVQVSEHFKVSEFASHDGADKVLISIELVAMLERLRAALGADSIKINSGYRTVAHNKKIGGSKTSKHCKGLAADIICKKAGKCIPAKKVCCVAQDLGFKGVAYISSVAIHVDMRLTGSFRVDESKGYRKVTNWHTYFNGNPYADPTKTVSYGMSGANVGWVQFQLKRAGVKVTVDQKFGSATRTAVQAFQKKYNLDPDGVVGSKTRQALAKIS